MDDIMNEFYSKQTINVNCINCKKINVPRAQQCFFEKLSKVFSINLKIYAEKCFYRYFLFGKRVSLQY